MRFVDDGIEDALVFGRAAVPLLKIFTVGLCAGVALSAAVRRRWGDIDASRTGLR